MTIPRFKDISKYLDGFKCKLLANDSQLPIPTKSLNLLKVKSNEADPEKKFLLVNSPLASRVEWVGQENGFKPP